MIQFLDRPNQRVLPVCFVSGSSSRKEVLKQPLSNRIMRSPSMSTRRMRSPKRYRIATTWRERFSPNFEGIRVLRTDYYDDDCPTEDRVGRDNDNPGGCSSYILEW